MMSLRTRRVLWAIVIAVLLALIVRGFFAVDGWQSLYSVMTFSFILGLPFAIGYVAVYCCKTETIESSTKTFFISVAPVLLFFAITLMFSIEGLACWVMIMPVFLCVAAAGGFTARYFKLKRRDQTKQYVYLVVLLPFFISPIEKSIGAIPGYYTAYTEISINAPKERIWPNVTRVKAIDTRQDSAAFTRFLGFPRPIRAELDKEAVGGRRKAVFDKGLVFDEQVIKYQPYHFMQFSIRANPYDIPATTMDKHIVVGGEFFDVLNGTYKLEQTGPNSCKLILYSNFKLNTTFNFYAGIWAKWIMKDIQQNILKVIKERSETAI